MDRGNDRQKIFLDRTDCLRFLDLLGKCALRFDFRIFAYALMPNHYHLLLLTLRENLSEGIHWLNGLYAQWFNQRHDRVGHLFQGRFKNPLVRGDRHLLAVSRYIHQNPVRAGISETSWGYEWSSCRAYLGLEGTPEWLDTQTILNLLQDFPPGGSSSYREFVEKSSEPHPLENAVGQAIVGNPEFLESIKRSATQAVKRAQPVLLDCEVRPSPVAVIAAVKQVFGIEGEELLRERWARASERSLAVYLLRERSGLSLRETGKLCSLSESGVFRLVGSFAERLRMDLVLQEDLRRVETILENSKLKA